MEECPSGCSPVVSGVLPVRDGLPRIREAIASLLRQTVDRGEPRGVDDASTDATTDRLAPLGGRLRRPRSPARWRFLLTGARGPGERAVEA